MTTTTKSFIHSNVLERLARLKDRRRLAHAYLFVGPKGIGKSETALAVAKFFNCEKPSLAAQACDCPSCRKIDAGSHPDIFVIRRFDEKTVILIEQLRDVMERLQLRPLEAKIKVCIIEEADQVRADVANAFLKTLEEPRPDTLLILTTSVPEAILPTVASRCHQVLFFPLGHSALAGWLKSEYHVESSQAEILARLSEGSPGRARERGADFLKRKNEMIDRFIGGRADDDVIKAYAGDREGAREFLEVLLTFFRDVAVIKRGVGPDGIVHTDRLAELRKLAAKYSDDDIGRTLAQVVLAMRGIRENLNVKVAVTLLKEMI